MNTFASIDNESMVTVAGGQNEVSGRVKLPGGEAEAAVKVNPSPVKQYGTSELLACKQQASDNFGRIYQSGKRLDDQLADCNKQFGK
jgi:hypothetical protein